MPRSLKNGWIDEYLSYVGPASEAPDEYHFWCAATLVAASLKRQVFVRRGRLWKLYPNMYTILVGMPGIGKGGAINPAMAILTEAGTANILSGRITVEYLLERLSKGFQSVGTSTSGGLTIGIDNSSIIISTELAVFMRHSDSLQDLNDLWDSREEPFPYGTRSKGLFTIEKTCQSLLGGSAPDLLTKGIPPDAVGGGFTRRVNFVYAKKRSKDLPWPTDSNGNHTGIIDDLRQISSSLRGEFRFDKKAEATFERIYSDSKPTEFDDDATANYKTSKWVHITKLALVLSASRREDYLINQRDLEEAESEVGKVTDFIQLVFRAVGESDLAAAADKVLRFIELRGYATRREILYRLNRHVSNEDLTRILQTFTEGGVLEEVTTANKIAYKVIKPIQQATATP